MKERVAGCWVRWQGAEEGGRVLVKVADVGEGGSVGEGGRCW